MASFVASLSEEDPDYDLEGAGGAPLASASTGAAGARRGVTFGGIDLGSGMGAGGTPARAPVGRRGGTGTGKAPPPFLKGKSFLEMGGNIRTLAKNRHERSQNWVSAAARRTSHVLENTLLAGETEGEERLCAGGRRVHMRVGITFAFAALIGAALVVMWFGAANECEGAMVDTTDILVQEVALKVLHVVEGEIDLARTMAQSARERAVTHVTAVDAWDTWRDEYHIMVRVATEVNWVYHMDEASGEAIGLTNESPFPDSPFLLWNVTALGNGEWHQEVWKTDERGYATERTLVSPYNVFGRPWYTSAAASEAGGVWSDPFQDSTSLNIDVSYAIPLRDDKNELVAVYAADMSLRDLTAFLSTEFGDDSTAEFEGVSYVCTREGMLVAASHGNITVTSGSTTRQLNVAESDVELIANSWGYIVDELGSESTVEASDDELAARSATIRRGNTIMHVELMSDPSPNWFVVAIVPREEFFDRVDESRSRALTYAVLLFAGSVLITYILMRWTTRSLFRIANLMNRVASFDFSSSVDGDDDEDAKAEQDGDGKSGKRKSKRKGDGDMLDTLKVRAGSVWVEVHHLQQSFRTMQRALRSFAKYVPKEVVMSLLRNNTEAVLGVDRTDVTIYFSDIEGFTTISERMSPEQLTKLLEEYLGEMSGCVLRTEGTVGKFIGDAVMAFWNSPDPVANHPETACDAALDAQYRLGRLRDKWCQQGLPEIKQRIGLHTGRVLAGNIGSQDHFAFDIMGDPVNFASRLEGVNKKYGTYICISEELHDAVNEVSGFELFASALGGQAPDTSGSSYRRPKFLCRPLDKVQVKGRSQGGKIFELIERYEKASELQRKYAEDFKVIFDAYYERRFDFCLDKLRSYLQMFPRDKTATLFKTRCVEKAANPPPADWDGVEALTEK